MITATTVVIVHDSSDTFSNNPTRMRTLESRFADTVLELARQMRDERRQLSQLRPPWEWVPDEHARAPARPPPGPAPRGPRARHAGIGTRNFHGRRAFEKRR